MTTLVIGASGHVGSHIASQFAAAGGKVLALTRKQRPQDESPARWIVGDLSEPTAYDRIEVDTVVCTASIALLAQALPRMFAAPPSRLVAFSSTGVLTKQNSSDDAERQNMLSILNAEQRLIDICTASGIAWTILRPTLIYEEGRDLNVTRIAKTIKSLGFFPLYGRATGLRQPVHAQDLATGAFNASRSPGAHNQIYEVPGGETITYREMVGRIFDGMKRQRRAVPIPPFVWKVGFNSARRFFPNTNIEMGMRMSKDHAFDSSPAQRDFGFQPRAFRPVFNFR